MNVSGLEDFGWRCPWVVSHDMAWDGGGVGEGPIDGCPFLLEVLYLGVAGWVFLYLWGCHQLHFIGACMTFAVALSAM